MHNQCRSLLAAILETAVDSIIVIDLRGIVMDVNAATETMFGYASSEVVGKNVKMLMPSPYRDEHDGYLNHYQKTGNRKIIGIGREVVGQRKDGSTFAMHLAVSEVGDGDSKLFAGIIRDITDLKETQRQLTELNAELEQRVQDRSRELQAAQAELLQKEKLATLGKVAGGIAHEIHIPLNVLKTSAYYLLNAQNPSNEKRREHLERIDRQVTMIDNVVVALSDVSRMPDPKTAECDVRKIIADVVSSLAIDASIELRNEIEDDLPDVLVDANQIPIVFRNLIRNARDAMPDGGTITLAAKATADGISIHVIDSGTGIPQEEIKKITEPLYSTKPRGMGLGLAITKAILDKNHGKLEVISEVGEGTTFTVTLRKAHVPQQDNKR